MPTQRETILVALHARLSALPATALRGEVLPERIPTEGLLILRDGEPGEPEVTLSPLRYHYQHRAEIEAIVQGTDRDAAFDTLTASIGTAIAADRTLGGLCDWVEAEAPRPVDLPVEGAASLKAAVIPVILHYSTTDPLGWPNFSPAEIACRGTGKLLVNEPALDTLQALRDRLGKPLIVRSAYRSPEHNRAVGGATRSKHMDGAAFDVAMSNHDPVAFEAAARKAGFLGFGFYPRSGFMHVDLGPVRQWGARFPVRATAFADDTPPIREVLADSRTMKGGGAAGVATIGLGGVEVAQTVLAETQSAVLPLVPYLDTLRWVFIAVALAGIAVTFYARLDDWRRGQR